VREKCRIFDTAFADFQPFVLDSLQTFAHHYGLVGVPYVGNEVKFHSRHYDDFVFKNTKQNKDSFKLLTLGQKRKLILTILSDQEYMSGVKEKLALISDYR
jgi:hypothetical protein